jgi:hypothetical protein
MDICVKADSDESKLADYADELDKIHEEVREMAIKFPVPAIG